MLLRFYGKEDSSRNANTRRHQHVYIQYRRIVSLQRRPGRAGVRGTIIIDYPASIIFLHPYQARSSKIYSFCFSKFRISYGRYSAATP